MTKRNLLTRVLGRIRWWFKWQVLGFPENVEDYGVVYSLQKIFTVWWWYDLKNGVKNLIKWFPVIWKDRDWDYHFWITINLKKLREMEKSMRNGKHVDCEKDADKILKAIYALERLEKDDYILDVNKWVDKKYGKLKMVSSPCAWDENGKPTMHSCDFRTTKWMKLTDEEKKMGEFLRHKNYKRAEYLKQQDIEYATKIINKYLFHWWT